MKSKLILICLAAVVIAGVCVWSVQAKSNNSIMTETQKKDAVIGTIMERRSIRAYQAQPVERDKMETIVECGLNAPNALNRQPWEVRVADNQEWLKELSEKAQGKERMQGQRNMFRNAPTVVFIAAKTDGYMGGVFDCALLCENMVLAAQSMGIGSCIQGGPVSFFETEAAAPYLEKLGFSEGYKLIMTVGFGYADEAPDAKPRDTSKARFVD